MSQNKKLSTRQLKAAAVLLNNRTISDAAKEVGINRKTLQRWLDDPQFIDHLRIEEGKILDKVARKVIVLADEAIDALRDIMRNPNQKGASQKRLASQSILENVMRLWEVRNIEIRIANLERITENE